LAPPVRRAPTRSIPATEATPATGHARRTCRRAPARSAACRLGQAFRQDRPGRRRATRARQTARGSVPRRRRCFLPGEQSSRMGDWPPGWGAPAPHPPWRPPSPLAPVPPGACPMEGRRYRTCKASPDGPGLGRLGAAQQMSAPDRRRPAAPVRRWRRPLCRTDGRFPRTVPRLHRGAHAPREGSTVTRNGAFRNARSGRTIRGRQDRGTGRRRRRAGRARGRWEPGDPWERHPAGRHRGTASPRSSGLTPARRVPWDPFPPLPTSAASTRRARHGRASTSRDGKARETHRDSRGTARTDLDNPSRPARRGMGRASTRRASQVLANTGRVRPTRQRSAPASPCPASSDHPRTRASTARTSTAKTSTARTSTRGTRRRPESSARIYGTPGHGRLRGRPRDRAGQAAKGSTARIRASRAPGRPQGPQGPRGRAGRAAKGNRRLAPPGHGRPLARHPARAGRRARDSTARTHGTQGPGKPPDNPKAKAGHPDRDPDSPARNSAALHHGRPQDRHPAHPAHPARAGRRARDSTARTHGTQGPGKPQDNPKAKAGHPDRDPDSPARNSAAPEHGRPQDRHPARAGPALASRRSTGRRKRGSHTRGASDPAIRATAFPPVVRVTAGAIPARSDGSAIRRIPA